MQRLEQQLHPFAQPLVVIAEAVAAFAYLLGQVAEDVRATVALQIGINLVPKLRAVLQKTPFSDVCPEPVLVI